VVNFSPAHGAKMSHGRFGQRHTEPPRWLSYFILAALQFDWPDLACGAMRLSAFTTARSHFAPISWNGISP
jgi:hypothetical protein